MNLDFLSIIDEKKDMLTQLSDKLWDEPETAFVEFQATQLLCDALREAHRNYYG